MMLRLSEIIIMLLGCFIQVGMLENNPSVIIMLTRIAYEHPLQNLSSTKNTMSL
jgi:hypothetical protein